MTIYVYNNIETIYFMRTAAVYPLLWFHVDNSVETNVHVFKKSRKL